MKIKTFREFIKEDYRTSLYEKGIIKGKEINFYFEKIDKINLKSYMATFVNKEVYGFLTDTFFGKPKYLRFFMFYHDNKFHIFIFNGFISHINFVKMLDEFDNKNAFFKSKTYSSIKNYSQLYYNSLSDVDTLDVSTLNYTWCLPGVYVNGVIKSWALKEYTQLLFDLKIHEKLGFDEISWNTFSKK